MVETRRSLLKKLAIGAVAFWSGSKRALASYFSENSNPTGGAAAAVADFYIAPGRERFQSRYGSGAVCDAGQGARRGPKLDLQATSWS